MYIIPHSWVDCSLLNGLWRKVSCPRVLVVSYVPGTRSSFIHSHSNKPLFEVLSTSSAETLSYANGSTRVASRERCCWGMKRTMKVNPEAIARLFRLLSVAILRECVCVKGGGHERIADWTPQTGWFWSIDKLKGCNDWSCGSRSDLRFRGSNNNIRKKFQLDATKNLHTLNICNRSCRLAISAVLLQTRGAFQGPKTLTSIGRICSGRNYRNEVAEQRNLRWTEIHLQNADVAVGLRSIGCSYGWR